MAHDPPRPVMVPRTPPASLRPRQPPAGAGMTLPGHACSGRPGRQPMPDPQIRSGRLSSTERAEIERLAERGLSAGQIAQRMNRRAGTVNFAMTAMGLRTPVSRTFSYTRRGREIRSFSPDEDALIEVLRCQHYTCTKIAEVCSNRFGHLRTPATISIRLRAIATREVVSDAVNRPRPPA